MSAPFCINCKYCKYEWGMARNEMRCYHPMLIKKEVDLLLGKEYIYPANCIYHRNTADSICSFEGKLFEQRKTFLEKCIAWFKISEYDV